MDRRPALFAIAVSLALHLGLIIGVLRREPVAIPAVPTRPPPPATVVWLTPVRPLPDPLPRGERETKRETKRKKEIVRPPPGPPIDDTPRRVVLTPSSEDTPTASPLGGSTIYPSDLPTEEEQLAGESERVSARVGTWLNSDLGAARVRGGLPDPSYGQLGSDLRAATDEVPKFIDTNSVKAVAGALLESWGAGAERYGKTGAAYAEPEGRLESIERPSVVADGVARGSPDMQALAQFLSAGARLQEFADGRAGLELYALVELKQHPSGALDSLTLIRPSGLRPFDTWVTERARHVGLGFSFDAGARLKALRSVWRFDGIILYRRKTKLSELDGRAALGMITMAALSALSALGHETPPGPGEPPRPLGPRIPGMLGRFDELTGEADMVDLTNPTYDCRVTLIEAD